MILSCLSAPFRLLGLVLTIGLLYLGWVNRDQVRRLVHRMTADPPPPSDVALGPTELRSRAMARLDSLARGKADSVVLTRAEVTTLVVGEVERRAGTMADSVRVDLYDGGVAVEAVVDAAALPKATLGPLADWLSGRQRIELRGALSLLKLGTGAWRIDQVTIRGLPLPRGLWERLLGSVIPGATGTISFPVDTWITGLRVVPTGAILYGRSER